MGANQAVLAVVVLPAFFLPAFASARRSVFLRRRARFLALSLPLLCPIVARPSSASRAAAIRSRILRQCRECSGIGLRGIPRYQFNICDWCDMPLEACPICGYALSIVDSHCRHCEPELRALPARFIPAKHLLQVILTLMPLGVLVYLIFFR